MLLPAMTLNRMLPRKLTLYTTLLLSAILFFISSKLLHGTSVYEKGSNSPWLVKQGNQNENIYDFEDFDVEAEKSDGIAGQKVDSGFQQGNIHDTEKKLSHLTNESISLRNAIKSYRNTSTSQHFLQNYISSLDALTSRHENMLQEFNKLKQNLTFTEFMQEKSEDSNNPVADSMNMIPVNHNIQGGNLLDLEKDKSTDYESPKCQRATQNVAFLKVHKAGSTTVQNILQRYALNYDINVALPNKDRASDPHYHYLGDGKGQVLRSGLVPIPRDETYNMLFNHVIYNRTAFDSILPAKTFYLAIVRQPEERFISAAFYYGLVKKLYTMIPKLNTTRYIFTTYLQNPNNYIVNHYFYNAMSFDFGIPPSAYDKPIELIAQAGRLTKEFDLIMLLEFFDHSLVLLKRRLCWELKDILYLPRNKGAKDSAHRFLISETDKIRLRNWQTSEFILYKACTNMFWAKVSEEGTDFFREVAHFQDVISYVNAFCSNPMRKGILSVKESTWNPAFTIDKEECAWMTKKETDLHDTLLKKAWEKYEKQS